MTQCSRHTKAGTTSQQRSTVPASRQGHGLSPGLKAQKSRVLTRRRLPGTESAGWPTRYHSLEISGEDGRGLGVQELPPGRVVVPLRRWRDPPGFEDAADRGGADPVA